MINNNRSTTAPYKKINLSRLNEDNKITCPITIDELKNFIKIMKKKAPGESRIGHQVIKQLPDNILEYILVIFNASLASGYFPKNLNLQSLSYSPKKVKTPHNLKTTGLLLSWTI